MKNKRVFVANCPVDVLTIEETREIIEQSIVKRQTLHHVVVNAGKLVSMQSDEKLYYSVVHSDIINADGQSIVWASKFLKTPLPHRVAGIDLMESLVKLSFEKNYRCFFFGAKEEVVSNVVNHYGLIYSHKIIAGYRNGYFEENNELDIAFEISKSKPDILFVAITSPKKELFLNKYKNQLNVPFIMGVGGSFDVIAGVTQRAPKWMQNIGLEWFYRLVQEPKRMWRRYLVGNTKFVFLILKQKFGFYRNPFESKPI